MAIRATVLVVLLLAAGSASATPRKLLNGAATSWKVGYSVSTRDGQQRSVILGNAAASGDASAGNLPGPNGQPIPDTVITPAGGKSGVSYGVVVTSANEVNGVGTANARAVGRSGNDAQIFLTSGSQAGDAAGVAIADVVPGSVTTLTGTTGGR